MRLLLDTHIFLWWQSADPQLPQQHRHMIADGDNDVFLSAGSVAEMSITSSLGKLTVPQDISEAIALNDFDELEFQIHHAEQLAQLPWHHRDPFDRMLVAQAQAERLTLLTVESAIRDYDVVTG